MTNCTYLFPASQLYCDRLCDALNRASGGVHQLPVERAASIAKRFASGDFDLVAACCAAMCLFRSRSPQNRRLYDWMLRMGADIDRDGSYHEGKDPMPEMTLYEEILEARLDPKSERYWHLLDGLIAMEAMAWHLYAAQWLICVVAPSIYITGRFVGPRLPMPKEV